jgi:streptogramin lyase
MRTVLAILITVSVGAFADAGDVVLQFDAPGGNPDGLTYLDGYLWITSDVDQIIYKIDPADGTVVDQIAGYGSGVLTGLTTDGSNLWSCSPPWIYERALPSGDVLDSIPAANSNGEGLAWDDSDYLWHTTYTGDSVYKIDPTSGDYLDKFLPNGANGSTGLAWGGGFLWVSYQGSGMIYKMAPWDPVPWNYFLAPCEVVQDLAWDGEYLWTTEYEQTGAQVYKIDPGPLAFESRTWGGIKAGI